MEIRPIRTDKDHRAALAEIDANWGAAAGTDAGDRLDVLLALVEIYEARRWPIDVDERFDPVEVLNYAIDELGHTQANWPSFWVHAREHRKSSRVAAPLRLR
jgi:HTH-type transcriptional regulator/antitoxin HigA